MDALDRELAAALAVDPSPEFTARVRARVAREPAPSVWRLPRLMLAAAALAVIVVAALSVGRVDRTEVVVSRAPAVAPPVRPAVPRVAFEPGRRPIRRGRAAAPPDAIQVVSIDDLPAAPMGDVVPQMAYSVVTMTGVHP